MRTDFKRKLMILSQIRDTVFISEMGAVCCEIA